MRGFWEAGQVIYPGADPGPMGIPPEGLFSLKDRNRFFRKEI
jgi:hypothetical protein